MRILLASSSSGSRGGGELFLLLLGSSLSKRGHEVCLWASDHPRMNDLSERFGAFGRVHRSCYSNTYDRRLRALGAYFDIHTAKRVAKEWNSLSPDVVHLNKQNLEDALDLGNALQRARIPGVCTIHITQSASYLKARSAGIRDLVSRHGLQQLDSPLVAVSHQRAVQLKKFLARRHDQIVCIPNGVKIPAAHQLARDRIIARSDLGLAPSDVLFLGVGRMVAQKRPLLFLQTARAILEQMPNAKFCWVGDGDLRGRWDQAVQEFGLNARVTTPGWILDPAPFYAAADVFLHTAAYEGMPLAVLEGLAAGLPCCLTPNLIEDLQWSGRPGIVPIDPDNSAWASRLQDSVQRKELGNSARQCAVELHSADQMATRYLRIYESTLGTP